MGASLVNRDSRIESALVAVVGSMNLEVEEEEVTEYSILSLIDQRFDDHSLMTVNHPIHENVLIAPQTCSSRKTVTMTTKMMVTTTKQKMMACWASDFRMRRSSSLQMLQLRKCLSPLICLQLKKKKLCRVGTQQQALVLVS